MGNELITRNGHDLITRDPADIGQVANTVAAAHAFDNYRERKAANTRTRQDGDLAVFADYLAEVGASAGDLARDPDAWRDITWGLVAGFVQWQLKRGYAVGTVNVRLSTVKTYARLALKAGMLSPDTLAAIKAVEGYSRKEGLRVDEARELVDVPTRIGHKKAEPVSLTADQVKALKLQPDTPQGRRDALLMCLLLDHGLRVGEVAMLTVAAFDLKAGRFAFYRPKVHQLQRHEMTTDTLKAAKAYMDQDAPAIGPLWRTSRKDGRLHDAGVSTRRLTGRVTALGECKRVGALGLSAHDCRHSWATRAAREGTPIDCLMDGGGWASYAMPLHYIERARIANEGVQLG
ncbi:MAG TPA: site-specific integrase [Burkholderiales bacterium]|nr:site-specific integrase [Burkholderiales bacterium]